MAKQCACGCGGEVVEPRNFIHGHNRRGATHSEGWKTMMRGKLAGRPLSEAHRAKLSAAHVGSTLSESHRQAIGASMKGRPSPMKGRKHTLAARQRMSENNPFKGEGSPWWRGGSSTGKIRNWSVIRVRVIERDGGLCRECGTGEDILVHHRNGNRRDNSDGNLVTLCRPCHGRVHRFWEGGLSGEAA